MSVPAGERVSVVLSREELAVILRLLGASGIAGYEQSWLKAAPDGSLPVDTRRALEIATNGLIARGFLGAPDNNYPVQNPQVTMPAQLIALIAACAFGEYSVLLGVRDKQGRRQAFFHELQGMGVIHTAPHPGVHQFDALNGRTGVMQMIAATLGVDRQQAASVPSGTLPVATLEQICDKALAGNIQEAGQMLVQSGVPVPTAQQFAGVLQDIRSLGAVTMSGPKSPQSATIGVATSPSACFVVTRDSPQSPQLTIQPVPAQAIHEWIASHIG
jgi:hypothetical protein